MRHRNRLAAAKVKAAQRNADRYRARRHSAPSPIAQSPSWGLTGYPAVQIDAAAARIVRVGGVRKLDRYIADFDPEGDPINGWSDRI